MLKRRNSSLAFFQSNLDLFFECSQSADAGSENDTKSSRVNTEFTGLSHRLGCRGHCELFNSVSAAGLFGIVVKPRQWIPISNGDPFARGDSGT